MIVNLSRWRDVASLKDYAYRSLHGRFFARRADWFVPMTTPHLALWWLPAGTRPTLDDTKVRLKLLHECGETADAFTFCALFGPPPAAPD